MICKKNVLVEAENSFVPLACRISLLAAALGWPRRGLDLCAFWPAVPLIRSCRTLAD